LDVQSNSSSRLGWFPTYQYQQLFTAVSWVNSSNIINTICTVTPGHHPFQKMMGGGEKNKRIQSSPLQQNRDE
jgi:hypothetical protein